MSIYKTVFKNVGGRDGISRDNEGKIEFEVVNVLDGKIQPENTTNPEHLFAAAIASCYGGAFLWHMEQENKKSEVTTQVELMVESDPDDGENRIHAVISVEAPELSDEDKKLFLERARKTSPYTKIFEGKAVLEINQDSPQSESADAIDSPDLVGGSI